MINAIFSSTTVVINKVLPKINTDYFNINNYWLWIAVFELVIIFILVLTSRKTKSKNKRKKLKRETQKTIIDFDNVINSSFNAKTLYDKLKVKCHPDRFPNNKEKNKIALNLFQEISKNKTDYKKLLELKEIAKQKLNINF